MAVLLILFMRKIFFATIAAFIALTSCKKDNTLYYNNVTMGNIDGEYIVSDQGNTFEITEDLIQIDFSKFEQGRVILSCDVLSKLEENRYSIRLTQIAPVLTKNVISSGSETDEIKVDNPIVILDLWYGGGYINMLLQFAVKAESQTKHLINLIYNGSETGEDGLANYSFSLRHNAYGEVPTEDDVENYTRSFGYVSFPVAGLIEGDRAKVTLNWHSHKYEYGMYKMLDSEQRSKTFDWQRTGFEHPQKKSVATPAAVCMR